MESASSPEPVAPEVVKELWYTPLTRVTRLSKFTAAVMFIALPFVGFIVGLEQGRHDTEKFPVVVSNPMVTTPVPGGEGNGTTSQVEVQGSSTPARESGTQPVPASDIIALPDDATTKTVVLGEYLVRYANAEPTVIQVLASGTVTQQLPLPSEVATIPEAERFITVHDFNYDGYLDLGMYVGISRSLYRYAFYTFNPETGKLQPLSVTTKTGEFVSEFPEPTFNTLQRTFNTFMLSPSLESDGVMNQVVTTYAFAGEGYVAEGTVVLPWNPE